MAVLLYGNALFLTAFLIQLIIWKINLPRRQTLSLLAIFFSTLIVGCLILYNAPGINIFGVAAPHGLADYLRITSYFISLTLAYMITYSAIEVDSPSLVMINAIAKADKEGLDEKLFYQMMNDDILVKPRIADLINDKMAYLEGEKYRLTPKGRLIACIFILYRKLLNAPKGG